jgi:hypothetical protein
MRILALDLASVTGLCIGEAGRVWPARSVTVKGPQHSPEQGAARLGVFLRDKFEESWGPVDHIVAERYLDPSRQRSSREVLVAQQFVGALHAIAACYGTPVTLVAAATVRKMCCGRANAGDRDETKRMVIEAAVTLGYLDEGSKDHNAADAALIFQWASWSLAQRWNHLPGKLHAGLPLLEAQQAD